MIPVGLERIGFPMIPLEKGLESYDFHTLNSQQLERIGFPMITLEKGLESHDFHTLNSRQIKIKKKEIY